MKFSTDQTSFGFETSVDEEKARFLSCLNKVRCKYSYVRIPKTGSASLNRSLYNATNEARSLRLSKPELKNSLLQSPADWWCHYTASWQKKIVTPEVWDNIFSFSVVRNPYARLYSIWKFAVNTSIEKTTFEKWVLEGCKSPWPLNHLHREVFPKEMVTSQNDWICEDGRKIVSCVFRLEDLNTIGTDILGSLLGRDRFYIHPHRMNQTSEVDEYKREYTPQLIDCVTQLCSEDLQTFKYNFEGTTQDNWFYLSEDIKQ